jgi:hypothetical protein
LRFERVLLSAQNGRCAICQALVLSAEDQPDSTTQWDHPHRDVTRRNGNGAADDQTRLVHVRCLRRYRARQRAREALHTATPSGFA